MTRTAETNRIEQQPADLALPADEPELHCPHCGYNLRGLPEDRCPECGEAFDRQELVRLLTEEDQPLPHGQSPSEAFAIGKLAFASLFTPERLGARMPGRPSVNHALFYYVVVHLVAWGPLEVTLTVLTGGSHACLVGIGMGALAVSNGIGCSVIAKTLDKYVVCPDVPHERSYQFWLVMTLCFSTHIIALAIAVTILLVWTYVTRSEGAWPLLGIVVGTLGWWWSNLGWAIAARTKPSFPRAVAIAVLPILLLTLPLYLAAVIIPLAFLIVS